MDKDFEKLSKRKRQLDIETLKTIDTLINNLNQKNPIAAVENASKLSDSYKDMQSTISKFGKSIDKKFKQDLDLDWVPDAFVGKDTLLDEIVAHHFIREGKFELAECFAAESKSCINHRIMEQFSEMFAIVDALKSRNVGPAIAWCQKHRDALQKRESALEFQLHKVEYLTHLRNRDLSRCVQYAKQHFSPLAAHHMKGRFSN